MTKRTGAPALPGAASIHDVREIPNAAIGRMIQAPHTTETSRPGARLDGLTVAGIQSSVYDGNFR